MATSKSAEKRARTNEKSRLRNKSRNSAVKTDEKKFRKAASSTDLEKAKEQLKEVCSKLDKAAKTGTIHKKKCSRKKSRLMSLMNKVTKK